MSVSENIFNMLVIGTETEVLCIDTRPDYAADDIVNIVCC